VQNLFTREIKTAAVNAASRYGVDGTGLGGLEGFFYRSCHMYGQTMVALLGRICPMQKSPDGERKQTYETPEEFDAALEARGLPNSSKTVQYSSSRQQDRNPYPHSQRYMGPTSAYRPV
jgi:hypothetical protein